MLFRRLRAGADRELALTAAPAAGGDRVPEAMKGLCAMENRNTLGRGAVWLDMAGTAEKEGSGPEPARGVEAAPDSAGGAKTSGRAGRAAALERAVEAAAWAARTGRPVYVMADGSGAWEGEAGGGRKALVDALGLAAPGKASWEGAGAGAGGPRLAYLWPPDEYLLCGYKDPGLGAPVSPGRWTLPSVCAYLEDCGADPSEAEGVLERTGGWDTLVLAEAARLSGRGYAALPPGEFPNAAPEELKGVLEDLKRLGPSAFSGLAGKCPGLDGIDLERLVFFARMLAALTVLVPLGENGEGETVWSPDPLF
jgi:hypothetical protein